MYTLPSYEWLYQQYGDFIQDSAHVGRDTTIQNVTSPVVVPEKQTFNNQRWQDEELKSLVAAWKCHRVMLNNHNNVVVWVLRGSLTVPYLSFAFFVAAVDNFFETLVIKTKQILRKVRYFDKVR